jgi:hypothetical protein
MGQEAAAGAWHSSVRELDFDLGVGDVRKAAWDAEAAGVDEGGAEELRILHTTHRTGDVQSEVVETIAISAQFCLF